MDTMVKMVASRRGFIGTLLGLLPGIVFASRGRLQAAKPGIQNLLSQMDLETLISSRPQKDASVTFKISGDKCTLYREKRGKMGPVCSLNAMGKKIWDACDGSKSPKDISEMLHKRYLVSKGQAWTDTLFFLARLKKIGAIL